MYRQQFLEYLDRYDNAHPRDSAVPPSTPLRRSLDTEWFRKPSTFPPSQSSSFSSPSQSSVAPETYSDVGLTRQEGESYLSTPCVKPAGSFDILIWWRMNEITYPRLAQVAKDILAIPIAQVGVERVFNLSKDVIGDRRHRLSTQTIRKIMIFKDIIGLEGSAQEEDLSAIEGQLPLDEIDDLLELPANVDAVNGVESEREPESTDEEDPVTPSRREQRPRKRMKPWRYRDDAP